MSLQSSLGLDQKAINRMCATARTLEESGEYEQGRAALGAVWAGVGHRPDVDDFAPLMRAEVLLRAGTLTGWIGHTRQIEGAQEQAKDFISEAVRIFEVQGQPLRVAEGRSELAYCYWRTKELEEARSLLESALKLCVEDDVKAVAVIRLAIVDASEMNFGAAIARLTEIAGLVEESKSDSVKGRFTVNLATFEMNLGAEQGSEELTDRALVHYAASRFYFVAIGHKSFCALIDNQLGYLCFKKRRFNEAHEHLVKASKGFARLRQFVDVADVEETRALAYMAEGRYEDAEITALAAYKMLKDGVACGVQVEVLITLGTARAKNGRTRLAVENLRRGYELAEQQGATEAAGRAGVTALEELAGKLSGDEAAEFYEAACRNVSESEHPQLCARLRAITSRLLRSQQPGEVSAPSGTAGIKVPGATNEWQGFSLVEEVKRYEHAWIEAALCDSDNVPSRAARLLGFRNHESLTGRLRTKHPDLLPPESKRRTRRRSIIRRSPGSSNGAGLAHGTQAAAKH